jgi:hypothetical protein
MCEHGTVRNRCIRCGGAGVCEHKRLRYRCALCLAEHKTQQAEEAPPTPTFFFFQSHHGSLGNYPQTEIPGRGMTLFGKTGAPIRSQG